jgi:hypothetical protein
LADYTSQLLAVNWWAIVTASLKLTAPRHRLLWQVTAEPPEAHWNLDIGHAQRFDQRALIGGGTEADHRADAEVAQLHEAWPVRWSRCDFEAPP